MISSMASVGSRDYDSPSGSSYTAVPTSPVTAREPLCASASREESAVVHQLREPSTPPRYLSLPRYVGNDASMRHPYPLPPSSPYDVVDIGVYEAHQENKDVYYEVLPSGYRKEINGYLIEPLMYQPTPKGLQVLVDEFNDQSHSHNLSLFDSTDRVKDPNKNVDRVLTYLRSDDYKSLDTSESPKAVILSHGQFHALPLVFANDGEQRYLFILDSSAASRYRGYISVANEFPELKMGVNKGTRQYDGQSCITDAVEVCMRALQNEEIASVLIQNYKDFNAMPKSEGTDSLGLRVNRFAPKISWGNFSLFRVPAKLAVTSQRSAFIKDNDIQLDAVVDDEAGTTFEAFRAPFFERAIIGGVSSPAADICVYLSRLSAYHATIIDRRAEQVAG